ncbi:hypothetical protein IAD21_03594 [Abditibacteriota bacterium]|nr:hypothetical protein IAD21_03594 [Abditibacteriota bacterium]
MTAQRQSHALFTEKEYWDYEEDFSAKHEYFRGEVFAMAGASPRHNDIAGNIYASLLSQLRGRPCRARISDQRIKVEATTLQTYPDVVVVCPPFRFDPNNQITLLDATVIVEVLSDSTRHYDQTEKFENYKQLHSLRHYLLVETERISVEYHFANDSGDWKTENFVSLDDVANLGSITCKFQVGTIYEEIDLI